jgi:hypothetical protein
MNIRAKIEKADLSGQIGEAECRGVILFEPGL